MFASVLWLVLGILGVSVLIILHEFGHYVCARATGMRVDRFSVLGIGPVVVRLGTWKGTEFVISAIPFGAYVHIVGMDAGDDHQLAEPVPGEPPPPAYDPNDPYLYRNRPLWARMLAILGGPLANYATAMVLFFGVFYAVGHRELLSLRAGDNISTAAASAGLLPGDEFLRIDDHDVRGPSPDKKIAEATRDHPNTTVPVVVARDGEQVTLQMPLNDKGMMGISLDRGEVKVTPVSLGQAAVFGVTQPYVVSQQNLVAIGSLFTGKTSVQQMTGPVGIVKAVARAAEKGVGEYVLLMAMISTLLGLFNLLPLPALDGGRMVFMLWEAILRRPIKRSIEELVHGYGMLALLALMLYITIANDLLGNIFK